MVGGCGSWCRVTCYLRCDRGVGQVWVGLWRKWPCTGRGAGADKAAFGDSGDVRGGQKLQGWEGMEAAVQCSPLSAV